MDPVKVSPDTNDRAYRGDKSAPFGPLPYFYSWDAPWNQDMIPISLDLCQ